MAVLFSDKTRWQHFWVGVALGLTLTILCVVGAMVAAEFKDKQHGGLFDWKDIACGIIGGIIGQSIQILVFYLIITYM